MQDTQIDLVLMDINTACNESGIDATQRIKRSCPRTKVIMTTSYVDPNAMIDAKQAGADSFWYKDLSPIELLAVMDRTMQGEGYWPEEKPEIEIGQAKLSDLTATELEVIHRLVSCVSIKKMAEEMIVEETTIKFHLRNICKKVHCRNKTELLILVLQNRLVLPEKASHKT